MSYITRNVWIAFISLVFLFGLFVVPFSAMAATEAYLETDYEGAVNAGDPLLINAMKTTMYAYVMDDEDIESVSKWIKKGHRNSKFFKNTVLPIMKNNCVMCHNSTSTMSLAAPDHPLQNYGQIIKYLSPGLPPNPKK